MSREAKGNKRSFWPFTKSAGRVKYRQESNFMHTIIAGWLGGGELMVVLVVALILFGSKRIPEFAKGLGQAMKEFKKASNDVSYEIHNAINQESPTPPPPALPPAKPQAAPESAAPAATVPKS
jgi:sec-independent protein translocase protein TatA